MCEWTGIISTQGEVATSITLLFVLKAATLKLHISNSSVVVVIVVVVVVVVGILRDKFIVKTN